ncbi:anti-anti-sigma factor [Candidatus Marinamargulisbacteria bacterium SCGC AAA071-K20]|nr:anti-anti-sigma factor [Candidatus Marinamargulisbacteria bacterium SCGC AAA071-K20]
MKTSVETVEGKCLIKVEGRLDTLTAPELEQVVVQVINEGQDKIILDLSQAEYISSAGFRVFIVAQKKTKPTGGQVVLMGVNDEIKEIFDISGFTRLFTFSATLENSISQF